MIKSPKDYFLVLGGGGIRGMAYVGAIRALKELNINFTGYAGTSVGSVTASLLAINSDFEFINDFHLNFSPEVFADINFNINKVLGISKGDKFLKFIKDTIEQEFYKDNYKKDKMPPVCFKDLEKDLIIFATNLTDMKIQEFSKYTTPNLEIAEAIRASVSIPCFFQPVEIENKLYVDGDLGKNYPIWKMSERFINPDSRILEFRLEDERTNIEIDNSITYLNVVYNTITSFETDFVQDLYKNKDKYHSIKLNTKNISVIDFLIDKNKRQQMIEIGYNETIKYFKEILPKNRETLKKIYKNILKFILNIDKELSFNNVYNINYSLYESFSYVIDYKDMIDLDIYNLLLELRHIIKTSTKKINVLGIKSGLITNKKLIKAKIDETIKTLNFKIAELDKKIV